MSFGSGIFTVGLRQGAPSVHPRPYADDITAHTVQQDADQAVEAVQATVRFTRGFAADLCLMPNADKSCRFSSSPQVREALKDEPGPPVRGTFKVLGVIQCMAERVPVVELLKRDAKAVEKMLRIARLPVPLRERRVCVAMSGMGTAAFGVCVCAAHLG